MEIETGPLGQPPVTLRRDGENARPSSTARVPFAPVLHYEHTDIPDGMTCREYHRLRHPAQRRRDRLFKMVGRRRTASVALGEAA